MRGEFQVSLGKGAVGPMHSTTAELMDDRSTALLSTLAADLDAASSGIGFIYAAIDRVQAEAGTTDTVLAIDDPGLGRQLFRAGRRPPCEAPALAGRELNGAALYSVPHAIDPAVSDVLVRLCSVALRMDVLRHDSTHDALTGLLNRRSFDQTLLESAARSERYRWPFALALFDLDHFKALNDRFGHASGDLVLRAVGAELRRSLRSGDVAARVGGDEFAVIVADGNDETVAALLDRVRAGVQESVTLGQVDFSTGVAFAPTEATDVDDLYRLADGRLYEAKGR